MDELRNTKQERAAIAIAKGLTSEQVVQYALPGTRSNSLRFKNWLERIEKDEIILKRAKTIQENGEYPEFPVHKDVVIENPNAKETPGEDEQLTRFAVEIKEEEEAEVKSKAPTRRRKAAN